MDKIISLQNLSFIEKVVNKLSSKLKIKDPKEILWLVYGSYVINMNNEKSDLDIIGIHNSFTKKKRTVLDYKNVPIHLSTITMQDLKEDGESRLYGSYFTGKIINPHIFLYGNTKLKNEAIYHAGKFIGPLVGYLGYLTSEKSYLPSQITSLVFIAYFSIGPSFDQVFLGYYISPEFNKIWECLCQQTILMLKTAKVIKPINNKYIFTQRFTNYKKFHFERMKIAARHWSYGVFCHEGDYKFPDWLFSKAEEKMKKADPTGKKYKEMIVFLKRQSGLSSIYI